MIQPLSATSRTMKIGLSSDTVDLIDLSLMARWKIRPRLMEVPGVANVAIWGQRNRMLHVYVEPERLAANGLTLNQMMTATADALDAGLLKFANGASVGTGGFVETPNQRLAVSHVQPVADELDLREVVVEADGTRVTRIGDVADVVVGHQPLIGDAVINDGEGLLLIVEKFPWANTLDVTRGVEEALAVLEPALPGIEVDAAIFRPATFIEDAIGNLSNALLLGVLLVVAVLLLFLFDWRTALISVIAIPLSLMAAAVVLSAGGATLNTMVLAGFVIAVGVVVDDAIIDVENIVRRLRQARRGGDPEVDPHGDPRGIARGPQRDRVRDAHRCRGLDPRVHDRRPVGRILPTPGDLIRPGGPGIDARRLDGHTGAGPHPAAQRSDRATRIEPRAMAPGALQPDPGPGRRPAAFGVGRRRDRRPCGCRWSFPVSASRCCPRSRNATSSCIG